MFEKEIIIKFMPTKLFFSKVRNNLNVFTQISIIRKFLGMSQAQLSKRTGINQPQLSNIEKGETNITINNLRSIANALSCDL